MLVVAIRIGALNVHRVFVDNGSSVNILYYKTYKKMGLPDRDMTVENIYLYGFGGEAIKAKGTIRLPVTLGEHSRTATQIVEFMVVNQGSAHNALIGRPLLKEMRVVTSIYHISMKFPTPERVGCVKGCQYESRECYGKAVKDFQDRRDLKNDLMRVELENKVNTLYHVQMPDEEPEDAPFLTSQQGGLPLLATCEAQIIEAEVPKKVNKGKAKIDELYPIEELETPSLHEEGATSQPRVVANGFDFDLDPRMPIPVEKTSPAEDTVDIAVDAENAEKVLKIGSRLVPEVCEALVKFLKANLDVFAWSHEDMVGIDPAVMCHHLNIDPSKKGARQKRRPISGERAEALQEEVDRLMKAGMVKESFYPTWLANPVLVKKPNGKWRTCIDFTDLNKACPKDSFPLPRIDKLVDSTAGHALLSFMDAYSGYNQIPMY